MANIGNKGLSRFEIRQKGPFTKEVHQSGSESVSHMLDSFQDIIV